LISFVVETLSYLFYSYKSYHTYIMLLKLGA
jgi:hypothetical protein